MCLSSSAAVGFDTSAYTTSIAMVSDGQVVLDKRIMLEVPCGSRGLRQSEAVFAHVKNMRVLFSDTDCPDGVCAVAYSEKPGPAKMSYMPVFCVGASHATAFAGALGLKAYATTHQHGHLYAAFFGNDIPDGEYGAMHVSGGTLELLNVTIGNGIIGSITTLGGSLDITCGQLIDRIGVAAGLPFPSGAAMEKLYKPGAKKLAVHVQGLQANLSGAETQGLKRLAEGEDAPAVCSAVFDCVAETLGHLVRHVASARGLSRFIMTGGVMAGSVIREHMINTCESIGIECVLAQRQYCGDNACGLALAAERLHQKGVLR